MENPQGQVSFLKRRRRVTTTPSGPKVTVSTEAPGMASILLNAVVARTCPPGLSVCCSKLRKPTGPARARRACQRWTFRALSIDLSGCSFTRASAPKSAKNYPWEPEESRISSHMATRQPGARYGRKRARIARQLAGIGFALPGSVVRRQVRCGKRGCRCQAPDPQLHGPYVQWTRKIEGKTVTVLLTDEQVVRYRA